MTPTEIIESNKLIAEFIQTSRIFKDGALVRYKFPKSISPMGEEFHLDELRFHKRWDWLMPVVEKIETINIGERNLVGVSILLNSCSIHLSGKRIAQVNTDTKRNAIIQFIKWYNTLTSSKV